MPSVQHQRKLYDFTPRPRAQTPPPGTVVLPDGTVLTHGAPVNVRLLAVHDWIRLDGRPCRIRDMRTRPDGGRILHCSGRAPYSAALHTSVERFDLVIGPGT